MQAFAVPNYQRIAETLRGRLRDGFYRVGERIPPSIELEKAFDVSNMTIRKAIEILVREGWLLARRGFGTVVLESPLLDVVDIRLSGGFSDWLDTASGEGREIEQQILAVDAVRCPPPLQTLFAVDVDADLWRMRRTRSMQQTTISYHINFGRPKFVGGITAKDVAECGTFVAALQRRYPEAIDNLEQQVEAIAADMDVADRLDVCFGAPLFFVQNVYRTESGEVAAVSHLYLRADRYRYSASIDLSQAADH